MEKKFIYLIFIVCLIYANELRAQSSIPTYTLTAKNLRYESISFPNDAIEFDIYLSHTNPPEVFEYSGGQYFFSFNHEILPVNFFDTNVVTYRIIESDLPPIFRPRNPSISTAGSPAATILRLSVNFFAGYGGIFLTNNGYPGTKIVKMRLRSKVGTLNKVPFNLKWRNPPIATFATKIFAYVGTTNSDITTPQTHIIDSTFNSSTNFQIYPVNNQSIIYVPGIFYWKKVNTSIRYKLLISDDYLFNNIIFTDTVLTDTSKRVYNLSPGREYYWKVTAVDSMGSYTDSETWRFVTIDVALIPPDNSFNNPHPPTFSWFNLPGVSMYALEIAYDSLMNHITYFDPNITGNTTVANGLLKNIRYFWRIKATDIYGQHIVSRVFDFKTTEFLISPPKNTFVNFPLTFSWNTASHATSYDYYTATDSLMNNFDIRRYGLPFPHTDVAGVMASTHYFWKVRVNYYGGSYDSPVWSFKTQDINVRPLNNSISNILPVNIKWNSVTNAIKYSLRVATDSALSNLIYSNNELTELSVLIQNIDTNTKYYWKVDAMNIYGVILQSQIWNFTTGGNDFRIPEYSLVVRNLSLQDSIDDDDMLKFDIYIHHNNDSVPMLYSGGCYYLSFNNSIASGNSDLEYSIIDSPLPENLQPRNPSIGIATDPPANVLRLGTNIFPPIGSGFMIPDSEFPGTKILTMRLRRLSGTFNTENIDLQWRNPPITIFATKLFANVGIENIDITTPATHIIENNLFLPVELISLTSEILKNNIILHWATSHEENNSGFEIERLSLKNLSTNFDQWQNVGFIQGNGTTTVQTNYYFKDNNLNSGKYRYRLKQIDYNGNFKYYELQNEVVIRIPDKFTLSQNYPNPFNPLTKINYELPTAGHVTLKIFDNTGKEIMNVINEFKPAGYYTTSIDGSNFASGVYYYRIESENFIEMKRMILLK